MADFSRRMTSLDASFLYLEQPNSLMHVAGIYTFAAPLDYEALVADVEARLPLIPRYTQRIATVPLNVAHPTWEADPDFDIRYHIVHHKLRHGDDDKPLATLCAKLFTEPLDRARPLWEMHLVDNYGRGSAMIAKTHHCMIDGASGVELMNILMDPSPSPQRLILPEVGPEEITEPTSTLVQTLDGLLDVARTQADLAGSALQLLSNPDKALKQARLTLDAVGTLVRTLSAAPPPTLFNGSIGPHRALAWARFSLNEVKAIKKRLGGTLNDVILSIISGALRQFLRHHGQNVDRIELKAMVPVNVRSEHDSVKLGNRVSMMVAPLPIGIRDPLERLRQVSAAMDLLKASGQAGQMERIVGLTDLLPPMLQKPLAQLQASVSPVNTVCTNVPGPRETRYILGKPMQMAVPLVPLAAGIGLGFAIMSYADQITIGINADADRVPDVWDLAINLRDSFDELWNETGLERVAVAPAKHDAPAKRRPAAKARHRASSAA
jgi:diacylglycerol O-acyltransferase / wax synthase